MFARIENENMRRGAQMAVGGVLAVVLVIVVFVVVALVRPDTGGAMSGVVLVMGTVFTAGMFALIFGLGMVLSGWTADRARRRAKAAPTVRTPVRGTRGGTPASTRGARGGSQRRK